ncbi:hypothetical protein [Chryseobacterium sp. EO14]|uniref:hypothetical protein n=1 Tax=Chryseobacterium sp. EO14 TaxID=2950551 RepID=UPI00210DD18C|nr:hypothetical protein [Chryseobacterium sp. EO14]MCQ4142438.1 hypothetical protein [Chryseobacterium sp. EO14]
MKTYLYGVLLTIITKTYSNAQVSIDKQNIEGSYTILDFNSNVEGKKYTDPNVNNTNGIIIPAMNIANIPTLDSANNGTFIFDISESKVKMFENNVWVNLTDIGSASAIIINNSDEIATSQGVIIGASSSQAKGVLILESVNKALILPRIKDPHINVKSPYPGMICYDVTSKSMAIFDGLEWNYWK